MKPLSPKPLLHLEGFLVLILACMAYRHMHGSWTLFGALFLAPDLSMLGYLVGTRTGARVYNLGHTYLTPLLVCAVGCATHATWLLLTCTIWVAHIGFDRLMGYGLKYETAFKDTHLGKV